MLERGIKQLIAQALDSKAKVFQTRIEGVVQNYIYTKQHPQAQEKHSRKHKTLDEKEDSKSSCSDAKHDVISDISQLIPIPGPPGTVTAKTTEAADKKLGAQDSTKSGTSSKGFQTVKKSNSAQGKSMSLAGRGEETRTGSPVNERLQADDSSRTREGKTKTSRVKAESLSRDDGRNSPKVEDSSHKMSKTTRVKVEGTSLGENCAPSIVEKRNNLKDQGDITSSHGDKNENLNPVHVSPAAEEMLLEEKTEKRNESDSAVTCETKCKVKEEKNEAEGKVNEEKNETKAKVKEEKNETKAKVKEEKNEAKAKVKEEKNEAKAKVKEEKNETFETSEDENLSKNLPHQQKEEVKAGAEMTALDDCIKQEHEKILLDEVPKLDTGVLRNGSFHTAKMVQEIPDGESGNAVKPGVDATVPCQNETKMQESVERLEQVMEPAEKVETILGTTGGEKRSAEGNEAATQSSATGPSGMKVTDLPVTQGGTEIAIEGSPPLITPSDTLWRHSLPDESQERQFQQNENFVKSEAGLEKPSSVASTMEREDLGQVSSTGEYSDCESDISEVSSVHTSDLSSFDGEISSGSESYDEDVGMQEGDEPGKREKHTDGDKEQTHLPESEQDSDAMPRRRSTRISSRRSTKEGESEISESEATCSRKESRDSSRKRRHGEKRNRKPRPEIVKGQQSESGLDKPRRRGRPRKDDRRTSSTSDSQVRRSRTHYRDGSTTAERSGSDSRESRSTRSQRQIKRTRCYSPSSEGTREVFLPRKRSRDDPI